MAKQVMQWEHRIGRRLQLRDLHILFAVVQCGGMAKAAAQLGVSQPSVSEAIANLEYAVGVQLLNRSPRGVEPTMYGEALLYRSRAAFDELRQGIRDIEFLADPTAGELRIACPETLTAGFLPAIIDRLLRKYPRVVFHVVQTSAATRFRELRERSVDMTLARLSNPLTETDVDVQALFNDQVWVVAGARNPLTRRRKIIEFAELAREPWVAIPPDNEASSFVDEAFKASGLDLPKPAVVTFSQHVRFHLLATGRYLTALPGSVLRFNAEYFLLKRLPVNIPFRPRPIVVVTLKDRLLTPIAKLFIDCARKVSQAEPGGRVEK